MRYNLVNILKKLAFTFAIISFSAGLTYAQSTISLMDENPSDDVVSNLEDGSADDFSLFGDAGSDSLVQPASSVSFGETENAFPEYDSEESFDGFAGLEVNQADLDEINSSIGNNSQSITPEPVRRIADTNLGENLIDNIDEDLFAQMSNLEKQTSLLTLELRRERIKTEIEAIRIARAKALQEEENARELKAREQKEWEVKQEKALLAEQEKLAKTKIIEEQLRQEKIVNAYKTQMLKDTEKWIKSLEVAYAKVKEVEKDRDDNLIDFKEKMSDLTARSAAISAQAEKMKENYLREISNYQAQITALGTRIDSLNSERTEGVDNPFSRPGFGSTDNPNIKLSEEYIILEITGKGDNLQAKISNKSGEQAFLVVRGTSLKSGHVIEEIAPTYIRADRGGIKDFIYFAAGGILDKEPDSELKLRNVLPAGSAPKEDSNKAPGYLTDSFLSGMFVD